MQSFNTEKFGRFSFKDLADPNSSWNKYIRKIHQKTRYVWPEELGEITESIKTNVTVQYGKLGPASKVKTTFEYWVRSKLNPVTNNTFYELHYKCYFENMDTTNWKKDGTDKLQCQIGFH